MSDEFKGPTVMYGPSGESRIFSKVADVPDGWQDDPQKLTPEAKAAKAAAAPTGLPMTREEVLAALESGKIPYKKNAGTAALYAQLLEALRGHLTEQKVEFQPDADAKELLSLLTPAE